MEISTEKVSYEHLTINSAGEQTLENMAFSTLRENGRVDYGIQFIEHGCCIVEDNGNARFVESGGVILQFPGVRQHYSFTKEYASHLMWIHFSGRFARVLDPLKSNESVIIKIHNFEEFKAAFDGLLSSYYTKKPGYEAVSTGYLQIIIGLLLQNSKQDASSGIAKSKYHELEKVISLMNKDYAKPIDLVEYANLCYVSKSRFIHIFKEYTGYSPYAYQLAIRMDRAKELLRDSELSIEEISDFVGYSDSSYFCRIFKKHTGNTPSYYRENK